MTTDRDRQLRDRNSNAFGSFTRRYYSCSFRAFYHDFSLGFLQELLQFSQRPNLENLQRFGVASTGVFYRFVFDIPFSTPSEVSVGIPLKDSS